MSADMPDPRIKMSTWDAKNLGENLGSFWKVCILACLFLMLWDTFSRAFGKKLFGNGVFYLTRFIFFIYGTAIAYVAGYRFAYGYRGFMQAISSQF
jgi:hypothetical protein